MKTVFLNVKYVSQEEARVSVLDRGFLYGDGFFETIKARGEQVFFLDTHISRLNRACRDFSLSLSEEWDWGEIIRDLQRRNDLLGRECVIKIIVTRGLHDGSLSFRNPGPPTVVVLIDTHNPLSKETYASGWKLGVFPHSFHSLLGNYKSLSYLFPLAAKDWALSNSFDEVLILDPEGSVCECSTANIYMVRKEKISKPHRSLSYLQGVMGGVVEEMLAEEGFQLFEERIKVEDLKNADEVFITNSLIEIMPVRAVEEKSISSSRHVTTRLQRLLSDRMESP